MHLSPTSKLGYLSFKSSYVSIISTFLHLSFNNNNINEHKVLITKKMNITLFLFPRYEVQLLQLSTSAHHRQAALF